MDYTSLTNSIDNIPAINHYGAVCSIKGQIVEVIGLEKLLTIGSRVSIINKNNKKIAAEVIGFAKDAALLIGFENLENIGVGSEVLFVSQDFKVYPHIEWRGRILNANAVPLDTKGFLPLGEVPYKLQNSPPPASTRRKIGEKIDLGVRAINSFVSCCYGQRMGVFAGSGVGKSVLISMFAKYSKADIKIIGLVGERGREVQEFIDEYLGEEGLKNSIIIVATGDEPALMRRQAAYLTLTIAEYFRDLGLEVLCIIDNVTRFAMAQREIGLASGEPPATRAYTPSVFSELPRLLERAGPGTSAQGNITGLFAVLVEGDDTNEPIADTVRGILDGHIILDRLIAERGRFPAVNVLKSLSRTMPKCNNKDENALINKARRLLANYSDMEEMIRIGAYKKGSNEEIDRAIHYVPLLEAYLSQLPDESTDIADGYEQLAKILE